MLTVAMEGLDAARSSIRNGIRGSSIAALALLVLCSIAGSCKAWTCSSSDRETLLDFKSAFVDTTGVFATWNATTNCCTWTGVTCREYDGAILELALIATSNTEDRQPFRDASYPGRVGASLTSLSHLQKLIIQHILVDGPIPAQWGDFSVNANLETITINDANLRDDIPSSLAAIASLQRLDLRGNHLTGAIPAEFCESRRLRYIDVSQNEMNYLLVPACLQEGNGRKVTVVYENQGPTTASVGAGAIDSVPACIVVAIGPLSFALLLVTQILL